MKQLNINSPSSLNKGINYLRSLPANKDWVVTIEEARTPEQNALYWRWMTNFGKILGNHQSEMHEVFRNHFLPEYDDSFSTSDLSKLRFSVYLDQIAQFAAIEFGIDIDKC